MKLRLLIGIALAALLGGASSGAANFEFEKPTAANTGPDPELRLRAYEGKNTITEKGAVIEGRHIRGTLNIKADDVTVRHCLIETKALYGIRAIYGAKNLLIENCELRGMASTAIYGGNFTARSNYIHDQGADGFKPSRNVVIQGNYLTRIGYKEKAHADGVQVSSGADVVIRGNNFDMPSGDKNFRNSICIALLPDFGPIKNVEISNNWLNGGGWTIQSRDKKRGHGAPTGVKIIDNRFGRDYQFGAIVDDGDAIIEGNVWEDTGEPIPQN